VPILQVFVTEHNRLTLLSSACAPKMPSSSVEKKESHVLVNMLHIINMYVHL
jgi:hypothetical protein